MPPTPDDGSGPLDVDAAFAEIVARWGEDPVEPDRPRQDGAAPRDEAGDDARDDAQDPVEEDVEDDEDDEDDEDPSPRHLADDADGPGSADGPEDRARLIRPAAPAGPDAGDVPDPEWFATPRRPQEDEPAELRALGEEGFVPADPAPLPRDVVGWAAWIAVVGAPLFLLVVALGWDDVPALVTAITAGVFVAGFATLVIRLPSRRDDDEDDGAVV
ncbi:hypothetical protein [Kineococcus sp. SYSU DK002]|uniref:hypothetical protein n=1 Tax=Kineococcus sp. SYSU DK002 TaxID=3383123 RepID=UPI003D7D527F